MYYGMVGNNGKPYANRAMNESDLLLMVGARVADRAVNQPDLITENKVLIHIDVDPAEIGKNVGPAIPLVGDAKHIFEDIQKEDFSCEHGEWIQLLNGYRDSMRPVRRPNPDYVDPAAFITMLSDAMEEDAVYVADVGQNQIWSCGYHVVDLSGSPDLEKLSAAYDMKFMRLYTMEGAEDTIRAFLENDESVLLECIIDPMDLVK